MRKKLTRVGNSKAVILPSEMVRKYNLDDGDLIVEETEGGILIRSSKEVSAFARALEKLRLKKSEVYNRMERQANDTVTKTYYSHTDLDDVDTAIIDS